MNETNMKHFKAAQIAGMEVNLKDLEKINSYALSRLEPADIFAFKVSMASNEIDRDYEVFPRSTLVKLANMFVGKTVVKDHDHRSDNQIARIFSTELKETNLAHMTKTGEVFTELIAKCYMVKTSKNADLIAEIQAGIRKEVSLGCRVDKAICSICGTDNVKTYCEHFPGKRYGSNQLCYFSLENASDAYELSFVAVPAQPYAGTVKSYGKKPCCEEEIMERKKMLENEKGILRSGKCCAAGEGDMAMEKRLTINHEGENGSRLTVNRKESAEVHKNAPISSENERKTGDKAPKRADQTPNDAESAPKDAPETAPDEPAKEGSQAEKDDAVDTKEILKQLHDIAQQFLVFQKSFMTQKEAEQAPPSHEAASDSDPAADKSQSKEPEGKEEQSDKDQSEDKKGGQEEGEAKAQESSQEKDGKSEPKSAEQKDASPEAKAEGEDKDAQSEEDAKAQEEAANKDKTAQARLRALDLALSLRKKNQ